VNYVCRRDLSKWKETYSRGLRSYIEACLVLNLGFAKWNLSRWIIFEKWDLSKWKETYSRGFSSYIEACLVSNLGFAKWDLSRWIILLYLKNETCLSGKRPIHEAWEATLRHVSFLILNLRNETCWSEFYSRNETYLSEKRPIHEACVASYTEACLIIYRSLFT